MMQIRLPRVPRRGLPCSSLCKLTGLIMLTVAIALMAAVVARVGGATDAFPLPIPTEHSPQPASDLPPHCALKYAAVLDLAELERSYGKSSGAYLHAFGNVAGQMNDCHKGERYSATSSGAAQAGPNA